MLNLTKKYIQEELHSKAVDAITKELVKMFSSTAGDETAAKFVKKNILKKYNNSPEAKSVVKNILGI